MESTAITFDQLPHVVGGLSEKLDRVLELLEKVGIANPFNHHKPKRRIVYAKEACTIIGKSLSSLYRGIKAPYDPIPSYKRGKLLYFYEDELYAWIEGGRKHATAPSLADHANAMTAGMKHHPRGVYEYFLRNIADEHTTISGECTEIKQAQLTAATTDDLNNMGPSIASAVADKVNSLQSAIDSQSQTVSEIGDNLTTSVNSLTTAVTEKIDNFTANPPVQRVEKTIRIAKESWQVYLAMFISVFTLMFFVASVVWQEARIEQCRISDIKYHYIMVHNGVNSAGLDSIESWFRNHDKVKIIESEVRAYEERVQVIANALAKQETARALDQKHRLEEKINELNSQTNPKSNRI